MADKVIGFLEVGISEDGREVVVNHSDLQPDANCVGHIVFSPSQARDLGVVLITKADEIEPSDRDAATHESLRIKTERVQELESALEKMTDILTGDTREGRGYAFYSWQRVYQLIVDQLQAQRAQADMIDYHIAQIHAAQELGVRFWLKMVSGHRIAKAELRSQETVVNNAATDDAWKTFKFRHGLTLITLLRHALDEHAPQPECCTICEVIQDLIS